MLDFQHDHISHCGTLTNFARDFPGFDHKFPCHICVGAFFLELFLDYQRVGTFHFFFRIYDVQTMQPGTLALRKPGMHLLRNGSHFIANLGWTNAVIVLPLAAPRVDGR